MTMPNSPELRGLGREYLEIRDRVDMERHEPGEDNRGDQRVPWMNDANIQS